MAQAGIKVKEGRVAMNSINRRKVIFTSIALILILLLVSCVSQQTQQQFQAQPVLEEKFVGSINSNKYHYPDCKWAKKIKPENKIWFSSPEDAQSKGYVPCKVCKPPG